MRNTEYWEIVKYPYLIKWVRVSKESKIKIIIRKYEEEHVYKRKTEAKTPSKDTQQEDSMALTISLH